MLQPFQTSILHLYCTFSLFVYNPRFREPLETSYKLWYKIATQHSKLPISNFKTLFSEELWTAHFIIWIWSVAKFQVLKLSYMWKCLDFFLSNKYLDFYNKVQCKYQQSILISLHDQIYVIEKIEHLLEIWPTNLIWGAQEAKETHTKKDIPDHTMLGRR